MSQIHWDVHTKRVSLLTKAALLNNVKQLLVGRVHLVPSVRAGKHLGLGPKYDVLNFKLLLHLHKELDDLSRAARSNRVTCNFGHVEDKL